MAVLKNSGNLNYRIKKYCKESDVLTLVDPHTKKPFKMYNAKEVVKLAGYKVVK